MRCLLNKPWSCSTQVSLRVWEAAVLNANRERKITISTFPAGNGLAVSPNVNYTNSYPCPNYSGDTLGTKANVLWIEVPKTKILWTFVQDGKFCVSWMELSIEWRYLNGRRGSTGTVFFGGARKSADGHNHRLCPNGEYDIPSSFRSSLLVLGDDEISLRFFLSRSKEGRFRGRFPRLTSNLSFPRSFPIACVAGGISGRELYFF